MISLYYLFNILWIFPISNNIHNSLAKERERKLSYTRTQHRTGPGVLWWMRKGSVVMEKMVTDETSEGSTISRKYFLRCLILCLWKLIFIYTYLMTDYFSSWNALNFLGRILMNWIKWSGKPESLEINWKLFDYFSVGVGEVCEWDEGNFERASLVLCWRRSWLRFYRETVQSRPKNYSHSTDFMLTQAISSLSRLLIINRRVIVLIFIKSH